MKYAALDVGSNSVRMLIGEVEGGRVVPSIYERVTTRLISGLSAETGVLALAQMHATVQALAEFRRIVDEHGVKYVCAAGTSALRSASNSREFIDMVREEAGFDICVISGEEEARLAALGVSSSLGGLETTLVMDIGGGSTELVLVDHGSVELVQTEPAGAVRLIERYISTDPPSANELSGLEAECARVAKCFSGTFARAIEGRNVTLVGASGAMTTLAMMDMELDRYQRQRVHGHLIGLERLQGLYNAIRGMALSDRRRLRGLDPDRVDLIIAGLTLTISIMEYLGFSSLRISDAGLLEGLLIDLWRGVGNKHNK